MLILLMSEVILVLVESGFEGSPSQPCVGLFLVVVHIGYCWKILGTIGYYRVQLGTIEYYFLLLGTIYYYCVLLGNIVNPICSDTIYIFRFNNIHTIGESLPASADGGVE